MTFVQFAPWLFGVTTIVTAIVLILREDKHHSIVAIYQNGMAEVKRLREDQSGNDVRMADIGGALRRLADGQERFEVGQKEIRDDLKAHILEPVRRKR